MQKATLHFVISCALLGVGSVWGQDQESTGEKPPFDPSQHQEGGLGMPSPYDKLLALEEQLQGVEVSWIDTYNAMAVDIDPDNFTDAQVQIPMVLGVRIADGILAIQARDAELLSECASDIEKLAQKLEVEDSEMQRANLVRSYANDGDWLRVFLELGFLQQDILQTLEKEAETHRSDLLIASAWMQGARYSSHAISQHYSDEASNLLREPLLVEAIQKKITALPEEFKQSEDVKILIEALPKLHEKVNVGLDEPIPAEHVKEINQLTTDFVMSVTQ